MVPMDDTAVPIPPLHDLPHPIGFVLGGGASSAAAQVGMLEAVLDAGVTPDLIVGTSAGSLNGAVLADDPHGAVALLKETWMRCHRGLLIGDRRLRQMRNLAGGHFMFRNDRMTEFFASHLTARTFEALSTRFACVSTDLASGSVVIMDSGPLLDALLASCAVPGVFPLVRREGRLLADGGYVANVPIRQALDLGAASIVVFDGRPRIAARDDPRDVRDSMTSAFAAALNMQYQRDLEHVAARVPVLCMPGQPARHVKGLDFSRSKDLIESAHAEASAFLVALELPAMSATSRT